MQNTTETHDDNRTRITTTDGRDMIAPACVLCGKNIITRQYDAIRHNDLCEECLVQDIDNYTDLK